MLPEPWSLLIQSLLIQSNDRLRIEENDGRFLAVDDAVTPFFLTV